MHAQVFLPCVAVLLSVIGFGCLVFQCPGFAAKLPRANPARGGRGPLYLAELLYLLEEEADPYVEILVRVQFFVPVGVVVERYAVFGKDVEPYGNPFAQCQLDAHGRDHSETPRLVPQSHVHENDVFAGVDRPYSDADVRVEYASGDNRVFERGHDGNVADLVVGRGRESLPGRQFKGGAVFVLE